MNEKFISNIMLRIACSLNPEMRNHLAYLQSELHLQTPNEILYFVQFSKQWPELFKSGRVLS